MSDYKELIDKAVTIACIGSREIDDEKIQACALIGLYLAKAGKYINSGNALGADQCFGIGVNKVDPTKLNIYLPFEPYNPHFLLKENNIIKDHAPEWEGIAKQYHGGYDKLNSFAKGAMHRNVGIVLNSQLVIACPNVTKSWGGGTGHGMRIAKAYGIPVINIAKDEVRKELFSFMLAGTVTPLNDGNNKTK